MNASARLSQTDIMHILTQAPIFAGVGFMELKMLAEKSVIIEYNPEEIVVEQGEVGDRLYIIMKGSVLVSVKADSSGWKRINVLEPNDVFGEIAVLRNIPRTARISTLTSCRFLTINAQDFLDAYQYFPAKARDNIQLVVSKRLQERMEHAHG